MHDNIPALVMRIPLAQQIVTYLPDIPSSLFTSPLLLFKITLLQFGVFLIDSVTLFIILQAIGAPMSLNAIFSTHVISSMVATIAPLPLGLGSYEATGVTLLHLYGLPVESGLAAILLLRGFTFWLPMIPGFWLAQREIRYSNLLINAQ